MSHGSSVKTKLGFRFKKWILWLKKDQSFEQCSLWGPEIHGNENLNNQYQDYPNGVGQVIIDPAKTNETVVQWREFTRKLSKYETPQLQQIPFYSSNNFGLPDINNQANTNNTKLSFFDTKQNVPRLLKSVKSYTRTTQLIGVINRSKRLWKENYTTRVYWSTRCRITR